MKTIKKDNLTVKIEGTNEAMGALAAREAAEYLRGLMQGKGEVNIVFAAAPSQDTFLAALLKEGVDWARVNAMHMDEYIGLPADAPQGFGKFLSNRIFSKAPFKSVSYIRDCGASAEEICENYAKILADNPPDVVFMGIGENAHIAFNDPAFAKFDDPETVKVVELDDVCRNQQVNDGCFAKIGDVPKTAITLTIPALMSAKRIFCMVPRATKANAVKSVLTGGITETCPASILRRHPAATMYCDADSAKLVI